MRILISLGHRCDVAFQLRRHSGDNTAYFFDWLATPAEGVITILNRDFDVFHPDHLQLRRGPAGGSDCVVDRLTATVFWHQFPMSHATIPAEFLVFHPPFKAKFAYLAQRFREAVSTRPVTLVRTDITAPLAKQLEEAFFKRFPDADARFLYINNSKSTFVTDNGHSVHMPAANRSLGDPAEWIRVLSEAGLIEQPYQLSTVEILGHDHDDYNLSPDRRFTEAELHTAVAANPNSASLRAELAQFFLMDNQLAQAVAELDAACGLNPDQSDWAIDSIVGHWKLHTLPTDQALEALSAFPPPRHIHQRHDFLRLLVEGEQFAAGRAACNLMLSVQPLDGEICFIKAECCLALDRKREAEAAIDRAIERNSADWRFHVLRADILNGLNQPFTARKSARRAIDLDDNESTRALMERLSKPMAVLPPASGASREHAVAQS